MGKDSLVISARKFTLSSTGCEKGAAFNLDEGPAGQKRLSTVESVLQKHRVERLAKKFEERHKGGKNFISV